uniref:Uncharacterized protein n=1 Tax=Kalanchoe fedtschenkoi TaxID=63787 RepID=A0A7N0T9D3_KALFE
MNLFTIFGAVNLLTNSERSERFAAVGNCEPDRGRFEAALGDCNGTFKNYNVNMALKSAARMLMRRSTCALNPFDDDSCLLVGGVVSISVFYVEIEFLFKLTLCDYC